MFSKRTQKKHIIYTLLMERFCFLFSWKFVFLLTFLNVPTAERLDKIQKEHYNIVC